MAMGIIKKIGIIFYFINIIKKINKQNTKTDIKNNNKID